MIPTVEVFTKLPGFAHEIEVGKCRFSLRRGKISCMFSYSDVYLSTKGAYAIDPSLPLRAAAYHCEGLPGAMRDSAPDRWGRHLIDRRNIALSMSGASPAHTLDEVDYLLGVYDKARQGALRYSMPGSDVRESPAGDVPPVLELKRLLNASNEIARGNNSINQVKQLLDAGSGSLGGARPKASVVDEGKLLLAKFSHPGDEWDVMAWEKTALDIAALAGIAVPATKIVRIGDSTALLLERFDRVASSENGERLPYISAMTLVGAKDGETRDYVDVADALPYWVNDASAQLAALFRRVALSVALNNTDDHLRNLGLVRVGDGWGFSPAFDININPDTSHRRVTAIYGDTGVVEKATLDAFAEACGLKPEVACGIASEVLAATDKWRTLAKKNGCSESECNLMSSALLAGRDALSCFLSS